MVDIKKLFRRKPKNKEEFIKREREADLERRRKAGLPTGEPFKKYSPNSGDITRTDYSDPMSPKVTKVKSEELASKVDKQIDEERIPQRKGERFKRAEKKAGEIADKIAGGVQAFDRGYERVDRVTKRVKTSVDLIGLKVGEIERKESGNLPLGGSVSLDFGQSKGDNRKKRFNKQKSRPIGGSYDLGAMTYGLDKSFAGAFGWTKPKKPKKKPFSYF